jgi:S-adenosylmethionine:tRNA ribosyltransferase-isomerase
MKLTRGLVETKEISKNEALEALINWMNKKVINRVFTTTQLLITPGYQFKICKGLITNFQLY